MSQIQTFGSRLKVKRQNICKKIYKKGVNRNYTSVYMRGYIFKKNDKLPR